MTNTSRRLRALASRLCQFEEADMAVTLMLDHAKDGYCGQVSRYMRRCVWTGPLAPWRKTVQEELESIYRDHNAS